MKVESLEHRRVLATLSFTPTNETIESGIIFVDAGQTVNVEARAESVDQILVNSFLLNMTGSTNGLTFTNYARGDSPFVPDDSNIEDDGRVAGSFSSGNATDPDQVVVPPPGLLGSFDITIPAGVADGTQFTLTANSSASNAAFDTNLVRFVPSGDPDPTNVNIPITDFGNLTFQVGMPVDGVDLELIPDASAGTVNDTGAVTEITVTPGTAINVQAQIEDAPQAISGYLFNFGSSDSQIVLRDYAAANNFDVGVGDEPDLDSASGDVIVSANFENGGVSTTMSPVVVGSFTAVAPTAPGRYTLTVNSLVPPATDLNRTNVTDANANRQMPIDDFGDLVIIVAGDTRGVELDLQPPASLNPTEVADNNAPPGNAVNPSGMATQITVSPGATFSVDAEIEFAPSDVSGYQFNFGSSDGAIAFNTFVAQNGFTTGVGTEPDLNSATSDVIVTANFEQGGNQTTGTPVTVGSFTVVAPTAPGLYRLTTNSLVPPASDLNRTNVTDANANRQMPIDDFGDLLINVVDTGTPSVSVSVNPSEVAEGGAANLVYTFTRTGGDTTQPLTVNYAVSGTATEGTDFTGTGTSVTIAANATTATVVVDPTDDNVDEADETVILTISPNAGVYDIDVASATGTIRDDDGPIVTFVGGVLTVNDGDDIEFFQFGGVGDLFVRVDGDMSGPFAGVTQLRAFGNEGDDSIVVVPNTISIPAEFFGGPGNDIIYGAAGNDMIDGGSGTNLLNGLGGNNTVMNTTGTASSSAQAGNATTPIPAVSPVVDEVDTNEAPVGESEQSTATNADNPTDVNADGDVSAGDALMVINQLNRNGAEGEAGSAADAIASGFYPDVNADNRVTALDALMIVNSLARATIASGESFSGSIVDDSDDASAGSDRALETTESWLF